MSKEIPQGGVIVTRRVTDGAGYLHNDNRAAHEGLQEADIGCCPHCQRTINLQEWKKEREQGGGGWCRQCFAPVCGPCLTKMLTYGCQPFVKLVDKALEENYRREQNRKALGI